MKPTVDAVASEHSDSLIIARLDIDENPKTLSKYGVNAIPAYIVFQDGEVVGKIVGGMPEETLVKRIFSALE